MSRAGKNPRPSIAPTMTALLVLVTTLIVGCSTPPGTDGLSRASSLPDLSGLAWMGGDRFLAVHDAKSPEEDALPRVSLIQLPSGLDGVLWQPQEIDFPGEKSNDFESVARIPGTSQVLLVESTEEQDEKPFSRRIFLARFRLHGIDILDVLEWPAGTENVEGSAVARVGEHLVFLYAERAAGRGSTEIRNAELQIRPLRLGTFVTAGTFTSPGPTGKDARPVSSIDIDSTGVIYVASAEDPGDDNGPFRSAVYAIGQVMEAGGKVAVVLYDEPQQLAVLDGLKVESLAIREEPGQDLELFVGLDDENYGGTLRPLPLPAIAASAP